MGCILRKPGLLMPGRFDLPAMVYCTHSMIDGYRIRVRLLLFLAATCVSCAASRRAALLKTLADAQGAAAALSTLMPIFWHP